MNQNVYDNSKDALAHIMREHGADVLLGSRLRNFFLDYAHVKEGRKNVVFLVIDSGAAEILKRNLGAGAAEQEIAFKQAVQRLITKYPIERSEIESVMLEFTAALGWKINIQLPEPQKQQTSPDPKEKQTQTPPKPQNQQTATAPQNQQQTASAPQTPPKPAPQKQSASVQAALSDLTPGQRNVPFGKYLWRVLDVQNGRALLLAEEILEERDYHNEFTRVTWENCELRGYLNGEFLRTFSSQEQERIAQTENTNKDNQWYGTPGGRSTVDRVFLLSIEEVVKYFGDSGDLRARKGWYWGIVEHDLKDGKGYYINDQYNNARIAKYRGKTAWWWLRSPGNNDNLAARVINDGTLLVYGGTVVHGDGGVRPALWLNL